MFMNTTIEFRFLHPPTAVRRILSSKTRESNVDYIMQKLNRIFVIVNGMMDCFELLNVRYTAYVFALMLFLCLRTISDGFGQSKVSINRVMNISLPLSLSLSLECIESILNLFK